MSCLNPKYIKNPGTFPLWPSWKRFVEVPCGKCEECRKSKAMEWGFRLMSEYMCLSDAEKCNCWFITLTYDDLHNPGVLCPDHMSKFIKSLRNKYRDCKIRYFYVGEYGSKFGRPHYHMIIFGLPIPDIFRQLNKTKSGFIHFGSKYLESLWGRGFISIGLMTLSSCCYTARYSLKKNTSDCYQRLSKGIGKSYFEKFKEEIFSRGCISISSGNGKNMNYRIPRYFLKLYKKEVSEDDYIKFMKWYSKNTSDIVSMKLSAYKDIDDFDFISMKSIDMPSKKVLRSREAIRLINQAESDWINFRDF